MKKILALLLTAVMLLSLASVVFAAGEEITFFAVNPYGKASDSADTIRWYKTGNNYFMFLPAGVNPDTAVVWFNAGSEVTIDGQPLSNGGSAAALTEGAHTLACGGNNYSLTVCQSANIPAVYITTESGSMDYIHSNKENKEPGTIIVYDGYTVVHDTALKQIKGRGNATWGLAKKPYNIKFDKKTAFLGMDKAKKWTLLASYLDASLMRNPIAWKMAEELGLHYTSDYRHVDLYANGRYLGNYIACESVEIGSGRVEINDLASDNESANPDFDIESLTPVGNGSGGSVLPGRIPGGKKWVNIPNNPENITGGYLLECDFANRYDQELCGFVTPEGQCMVIKEPEYASKAEVDYISGFFGEAEEALYSPDGRNSKGKHYSDYFDMDSLVKMYILEEFAIDVDAGQSSCYFCLDRDSGKLIASPAWDFDHGNGDPADARFGVMIGDPSVWYVNSLNYSISWGGNAVSTPIIFRLAYQHADFRAAVAAAWSEYNAGFSSSDLVNFVNAKVSYLTASGAMDAFRWNHLEGSTIQQKKDAYIAYNRVGTRFITNRTTYLNKGFSPDAAMIYYENNGGTGLVFEKNITLKGDTVAVLSTDATGGLTGPEGRQYFMGWNTKADGSGKMYQPGESITLNDGCTILYAVWSDGSDNGGNGDNGGSVKMSFWDKIVAFFKKIGRWLKEFFVL